MEIKSKYPYPHRPVKVGANGLGFYLEVRDDITNDTKYTYLTDAGSLRLADFILANVERPKPKSAADQIRELPIGTKFVFTDNPEGTPKVRVSEDEYYHSEGILYRISGHETTSYGIKVVE